MAPPPSMTRLIVSAETATSASATARRAVDGLGADVDHARPAAAVDVGEAAALGARGLVRSMDPPAPTMLAVPGYPRSSQRSSTSAPASARSTGSGMTASASAAASAESTWLPCPPASRTRTRPLPSRTGRPSASADRRHPLVAAAALALGDGLFEHGAVDRAVQARLPGEPPDHRPHEQLERDERRDRVAGQPEQEHGVALARRRRRGRTRTACPAGRRRARGRCGPTASNAVRTTSYGPTDTPPDTTTMSASAIPRRSRASTSSSRSAAIPSSRGTPPASRTSARSPGPFASGIPAGPRSVPAARTSSPVARTATTGRRRTTTSASPAPDASATTAGVTVTPGSHDRRAGLDVASPLPDGVAHLHRLVDEARRRQAGLPPRGPAARGCRRHRAAS